MSSTNDIFLPQLSRLHLTPAPQRPQWVTLSHEEAARARRILEKDFWAQPLPLKSPDYKGIGLPFSIGQMPDDAITSIYRSAAYRMASLHRGFGYKKRFSHVTRGNLDKKVPRFMRDACRHIVDADEFIYKVGGVWRFDIDILKLKPNEQQRKNAIKFHRDSYPAFMESINNPGRRYNFADHFQTEFRKPFPDKSVVHHIFDDHRSPHARGTRLFLRGTAFVPGLHIPVP